MAARSSAPHVAGATADDLVVLRPEGLYCPQGDFHIDPWRPVARALITHAHADHARGGHRHYLCTEEAREVMRVRLGAVSLQTLAWGEAIGLGSTRVSFHPAGHVLGSAQLRIECAGRVWVITGDYKLAPDPTCRAFEPVRCEVLITESTFGLPVYRWDPPDRVFAEILDWWQTCAGERRPGVLLAYSLGKAQRLIAGLWAAGAGVLPGPLAIHPAIDPINRAYRATGRQIPECEAWTPAARRRIEPGTLLIAPPAVAGSAALERAGEARLAVASGWMQVRGARRRRGVDRGFVLSDHADWPALNEAIRASGASRVIVTHGFESVMVRHLREAGLEAASFTTEFGDERGDDRGDDRVEAGVEAHGEAHGEGPAGLGPAS
jgi:putative mRNA 3-end processing factor